MAVWEEALRIIKIVPLSLSLTSSVRSSITQLKPESESNQEPGMFS
eukprot:CAMPEP_0178459160 /NCGR_PEP_ID=MMETSP0689_2-20121128/47962_1 /TAXON_ID=160604 /ORGANISM="Amphidinium massartii, Strain CS-259" /LENGTH=45 /DNA_ID= /DNA_START= /DNA_END= /DNA_ORIENTATION=